MARVEAKTMEVANLVDMQERVMIVVKAVVEVVDASLYLLLFFHLSLSLSRPYNSSHRFLTLLGAASDREENRPLVHSLVMK